MSAQSERIEKAMDEMTWQTRVTMIAGTAMSNVPLLLLTAVLTPALCTRMDPHFQGPVEIKKTGRFDLATGLEIGRVFCTELKLERRLVGRYWAMTQKYIGTTLEFRDMFRRLADAAKLTDAERIEFFTEIGKFIGKDERVRTSLGGNLEEI